MQQTYFRKGFGLKTEVRPIIDAEYHSGLVERIRSRAYTDRFGDVTVRLAREFGFCYGVDRAVDYALRDPSQVPRQARLPGGRDHPQPAREPAAARNGHRVSRPGRRRQVQLRPNHHGRRRDHSGVRRDHHRHEEAPGHRLHPCRHDLRLRPARLEACKQLRTRRLHRLDPRQVPPRGVASHRQPGAPPRRRQVHRRARHGRGRARRRLYDRPGRRAEPRGVPPPVRRPQLQRL